MNKIGQILKQKRKEIGLTQKQLSEKIGINNCTAITRIEKGTYNISLETLKKYCDFFNCSSNDILKF